jgi:hypothetical protein
MSSKFPLTFPVCLDCGSSDTVAGLAYQEEIDAGNKRVPVDTFKTLETETRYLVNPQTAILNVPALRISWDICAGCGKRRCVKVEKELLPIKTPNIKAR